MRPLAWAWAWPGSGPGRGAPGRSGPGWWPRPGAPTQSGSGGMCWGAPWQQAVIIIIQGRDKGLGCGNMMIMTAPFILHLMGFWDHLMAVIMFLAHIFCARGNVCGSRLMQHNYNISPGTLCLGWADVWWNVINITETAAHMLALLTSSSQNRNLK